MKTEKLVSCFFTTLILLLSVLLFLEFYSQMYHNEFFKNYFGEQ